MPSLSSPADNQSDRSNPDDAGVRVGIGGWTYAPWRNNFYPDKLVQHRELEYASRQLTAIEVNGTFYGAQKPATYAKWRLQTPDGFMFSLKAPRYTTDRRVLADAATSIMKFINGGIAELGDRLGPINWQFPPHKSFDADDFAAFLALLPGTLDGRALRHVVEVRHASFRCAEYVALARGHSIATVFTDSSEHPSFADLTGDFAYARLMRSKSSISTGYPPAALDRWAARARAWSCRSQPADLPHIGAPEKSVGTPRDVFIFFIGAAKERNPAAAMALLTRLRKSKVVRE